jgi:hypothetical protein
MVPIRRRGACMVCRVSAYLVYVAPINALALSSGRDGWAVPVPFILVPLGSPTRLLGSDMGWIRL